MAFVEFRVVFRGDTVWINPSEVRSVHKRGAAGTPQALIRFAGLPDASEILVEGAAEEVIRRLEGLPVRSAARAPRPVPAAPPSPPLNPEVLKGLIDPDVTAPR